MPRPHSPSFPVSCQNSPQPARWQGNPSDSLLRKQQDRGGGRIWKGNEDIWLIYHPEFILHTDYLKPNYFYGKENGCIYWSIQELYKDGITNIDAYNLSNKLQSNPGVSKTMEKYNMPSVQEFIELYKGVARNTLEEYELLAQNIVTLAFKRDMIKTFNKISHTDN